MVARLRTATPPTTFSTILTGRVAALTHLRINAFECGADLPEEPGVPRNDRRRFLQTGLAMGALLAMPLWAWGQAELLDLPKLALVLGNGRYRRGRLRNPPNDARAIAAALTSMGFSVIVALDMGRAQIEAAIQDYTGELAKRKCVGLFYYAGHGLQVDWKNYMVPVEADLDTIADVQEQAVEVGTLLAGITRAANPMNVIILDACRDNPFGSTKEKAGELKGLSQMDAPPSTLLAYATSPGHVASDGEGANGLYTEHLLKEMQIPGAKIEDVFKRVRIGVRRKSNGQQIPWESTSLEEDFWFIPPKDLRTLSEQERGLLFKEELTLWEKIKDSKESDPFEDYLRRYPSGQFAELAQLQLELVLARQGEKRIRIASQEGNPFTKGSAEADIGWKVGDTYVYRRLDLLANTEMRTVQIVTSVAGGEVRFSNGLVTDLLGNTLRRGGGRIYTPNQLEPLDYMIGKQWKTQFRITTPKGATGHNEMELRIVGRESVTVPAGTFHAYRIEGHGVFEDEDGRIELTSLTKWAAPDQLRREVAMEETRERVRARGARTGRRGRPGSGRGSPKVTQSLRWELVSFKQG